MNTEERTNKTWQFQNFSFKRVGLACGEAYLELPFTREKCFSCTVNLLKWVFFLLTIRIWFMYNVKQIDSQISPDPSSTRRTRVGTQQHHPQPLCIYRRGGNGRESGKGARTVLMTWYARYVIFFLYSFYTTQQTTESIYFTSQTRNQYL